MTPEMYERLRDRWQCDDVHLGMRCAELGTFSPSTTGGGPKFCWRHARFVHGGQPGLYEPGHKRPPPQGMLEGLALIRSFTKAATIVKPLDVEAELERAAIQNEP